ncbi:MAG: acyl-CoA dehydratase activase [Deltaproteobacteria bacterium]|nr:acyl-CoA dehydratase activase [Deltaproteobacteria bacterium]
MAHKEILSQEHSGGPYYVGIDAGSVSLNCVVINHNREIICEFPYKRHLGRVEENAVELIRDLYQRFGEEAIRSISFTGNHGKKLSEKLGTFYEFESISQVIGVLFIMPDVRTIIVLGGQDTALFQIGHAPENWELEYFNSNGPCASGTGSFIDQQAQRLATSLYAEEQDISQDQIDTILTDFIELGLTSDMPANVACRCTVFTKSDMIHLQNKGEKLEDIIYGLHLGNAMNYMSTIVSNRRLKEPMVFVGGLSLNSLQVKAFQSYLPELIVPTYNTSTGALGVALRALELGSEDQVDLVDLASSTSNQALTVPFAPRLTLEKTLFQSTNQVQSKIFRPKTKAYLGIDIGSTTTKYALVDEEGKIIHKTYVPTQGRPIEVTKNLLGCIRDDFGERIEIAGTATTGSGRNVVGDFLNADLIIDEITAHAKGAVAIDREVDTIFEIGGQDSKYIHIANTYPLDFDMNKVCAAGTGSFLHELANKYGINIVGEFQEIALSARRPVRLAERCTVFMESDLVAYDQLGLPLEDLIGGLCYAIVHNYLNRVVGDRKIGQRVMFLGGPSLNKGVVAAFENVLGKGLIVPRHREVLGAYGAALGVQEKMHLRATGRSTFRGLASAIEDEMNYREKTCQVDPHCHNQCKLKIYDFDGRRSTWGGECGRYEHIRKGTSKKVNLFKVRQKLWEKHMAGVFEELTEEPLMEISGRPTVGMQRALYGHQSAIVWAHFFDRLGFRLVLTPPTNTRISRVGIESVAAETCYPVKVSHGHIKELIGKTTYLFLPSMIDMSTAEQSEVGSYCPMLQTNAYTARMALGIDKSALLSPVIHGKYDPDTRGLEIAEMIGAKLGVTRSDIQKALYCGLERQNEFLEALQEMGRTFLAEQKQDEAIVVVTGRPYNLYDERLNLRLGQNLRKINLMALPMDFIDVDSEDLEDFSFMYWGLGAQILRTAKFIKRHPNCFGLHLTNFGCGPDSFIEHFYKYILGEKPSLILELDEHSAVAGVMTRLEAYKNVIENKMHGYRSSVDERVSVGD